MARKKGSTGSRATTKGDRARATAERQAAAAAAAAESARRRRLGLLAALVALALVAGVGAYGWWRANKAVPTVTPEASTAAPVTFAPVTIAPERGVRIGAADAPGTVTVYLDFHCPHCQVFEKQYGPTLNGLMDSGRIAVEYWPLGFLSPGSRSASNAFACAAERDPRFARSLHDAFFVSQQPQWTDDQILGLSRQLRPALPDGYEACVVSKPHLEWVTRIHEVAKAGPASQGTPTVYVNGTAFDLTKGTPDSLVEALR